MRGNPGKKATGCKISFREKSEEVGFESDRFTRSVIDFEFLADDYQNPEASGLHLFRMSLKWRRTEGGVLFQDWEDPPLGALEITDDGWGKGSLAVDAGQSWMRAGSLISFSDRAASVERYQGCGSNRLSPQWSVRIAQ